MLHLCVPLHPVLACQLMEWHAQTPYAKATDFIFPSLKAEGACRYLLQSFLQIISGLQP